MVKNAYVHVPFCKSKCNYCSFVSFPNLDLKCSYLTALRNEILHFYNMEKLNTLYIGGGTPSLLVPDEVKNIVSMFLFENNAEITIELNPETLTLDYLKLIKTAGINRISIGCQTFDDSILKIIGRRHNAEQVSRSVKFAQTAGFDNISLDFIYGLPYQTIEGFENDLKTAVSLGVKHISLYGLKIDEGCYFYKNYPENLPDEDMQADMYMKAIEILGASGFEHYEISNFARKDFYSRHNLNYWDNNSYYGFGIGAHGYDGFTRYYNFSDFENYFENPLVHANEHILSNQEQLEEEIFLGFRRMSGINTGMINKKFDIDFDKKYSKIIEKYVSGGFISKTQVGYKLTDEGILVSNVVLSEFLE